MDSLPPPPIGAIIQPRGGRWTLAAIAVWGLCSMAGFWALWSDAARPGAAANSPDVWPAESGLARAPGRWTLIMFIPPRCACTSASLTELEEIQARAAGALDVRIISRLPAGADPAWMNTSIARRAAALPGAIVVPDAEGRIARLFGARTSGEILLYDPAGRLAYHGGITGARAHEGDNPGSDAVLALVAGKSAPGACPAFGCPLFSPAESPRAPLP
jgi:hypothetical protein